MKLSPKKLLAGLTTAFVISASSIAFTPSPAKAGPVAGTVAAAGIIAAGGYLANNWGSFVSHLWSPRVKQVFMTSLSWQETRDVRNQHRERADGVLHDRCIDKVTNMYYSGWRRTHMRTSGRWVFSTRVENNQANCYQRMPNHIADDVMRIRGW